MPIPSSRALYREFISQPLRRQTSDNPVNSQPGSFRVYLNLLGEHRRAFIVIFVAACLTELLYLAVPVTTRHIIDGVLMNTQLAAADKTRLLMVIGGVLFGLLVAAQGIDFWRRFFTAIVNGRFVRSLRLRLFSHLMRLPLGKVHELKTGGIVSRLTSDAENLTGLLQMAIISPGVAFLRIAITFGILIYWHLPLAIVASGFIPPLVYISLIYILRVRPVYRSVSNDRSAQDARTSEVFSGIRAVKAFEMQQTEKRRYNTVQGLMFRKNIFASLRESAVDGIWNFLIPVTSLLIMVIGGFFFLRGETSIGDLVAFQMYSGMLLYPVWRMVFSLSQIQKSMASLDRVLDMLSLEGEQNTGELPMPAVLREIRFTDVSFGYRENQSVLRDISLVLKPSRIYAIVGESGIGKTTLIDLLCRFYQPQLGHISLNGVQSDRYDLAAWRAGISIVTQDAILFDGSVRENLLISSRPLSDAQLLRALRGADAQDFIDELPQGLDTLIGERGFRLSGGQKHRLTLARALVKGAPVLVLDEATAHLDSLSEQKIRVQLDKLKKNRVVIMITHRLSTVTHADEIIVLNGGSVEAIGTHRDLLRRSRTYKRLWSAQ
ncbi:MAG TPA: ABC transporter ATP-binding protein [Turneriella sp.]|nr:ABC transporter ATP-binding protein [Turneriella sp.]HNL54331.1 ABC transporter ATP-binding protein [Turneriella sp.]